MINIYTYGSSAVPRLITRTVYELLSTLTNFTATDTYLSRLAGTKPVNRFADLWRYSPASPCSGLYRCRRVLLSSLEIKNEYELQQPQEKILRFIRYITKIWSSSIYAIYLQIGALSRSASAANTTKSPVFNSWPSGTKFVAVPIKPALPLSVFVFFGVIDWL